MTHSIASEPLPAGEPVYSHNGYRIFELPGASWLVMDGQGAGARRAATFTLPAGSCVPSNLSVHGLYSTQRCRIEDLASAFASMQARLGVPSGG